MLDLLAAISSVDPPSFVAWAVLVFAAGMYPVGIMLGGSCSPCCTPSTPCTTCTEGELPETLTVTFNGLADRTPGPDLITLGFSASFGGGASAKVTAPGGDPATNKGPISAVSLTSGGSGYAKLGRVAPTLTISGGSGSGATFTPSLTSSNDAFGIPSWALASVAFSGGTGYVDGESLTVAAAEGDTEAAGASVVVNTTRTQPTITASASGGTGATFTVTLSENAGPPKTWSVSGVTVTNGGSGYQDGASLTFTPEAGTTTEQEAYATAIVGRTQPTVTASASGGTGAALSVTLSQETDWYTNQPYWVVSGVTVTNGGTDYTDGDPVTFNVTDGTSWYGASATISVTDGEITGVNLDYYGGGYYYKSTGIITGVDFGYWGGGGSYFKDDGIPTGVTVTSGGQYYREDASAQPYVASVTVSVSSQAAPSNGTGATFTAQVESSTSSPNFGKIKSVSVANGGNNYLAWQWRNTKCCGDYYNGMSVVVKRLNYGDGNACHYSHRMCGVGNIRGNVGQVVVSYNGPTTPPSVFLQSELPPDGGNASSLCNTAFTASGNVTNCSVWSGVTFSSSSGATASVTAGGEYDATDRNPGGSACNICCKGDELPPQEITVSVTGGTGSGFFVSNATNSELNFPWDTLDGDFVLPRLAVTGLSWGFNPPPVIVDGVTVANPPPLSVSIEPCSSQTATSFGEDGYGCDDCHKKCRIVFAYTGFEQRFCKGNDPNHCGTCIETPKCSPAGASFTLCAPRYLETKLLGSGSQVNPNPPPVPGTPVDDNDCTDYGPAPEWTKYPIGVEVDPVTGIGTGVIKYAYAWPRPGNRCPMQVTIS